MASPTRRGSLSRSDIHRVSSMNSDSAILDGADLKTLALEIGDSSHQSNMLSDTAKIDKHKDLIKKRRNSKLLESKENEDEERKEDAGVFESHAELHQIQLEEKRNQVDQDVEEKQGVLKRKEEEKEEEKEKRPVRKESGILRKSSLVANDDLRAEFQNTVKKRVSFSNWASDSSFNDSISSLSSFRSTNEATRKDSLTSEPKRRNSIPSRTSSSSSSSSSSVSSIPLGSELNEHERSEKVGNSRQYGIRLKGRRSSNNENSANKDALAIDEAMGGSGFSLVAVFDGHGKHGRAVARHVAGSMSHALLKFNACEEEVDNRALYKRFQKSFLAVSKRLSLSSIDISFSGTTASVVLCNPESRTLRMAHVGDSNVVLAVAQGSKLVAHIINHAHTPDVEAEGLRIIEQGGEISNPKYDTAGKLINPSRVYSPGKGTPGIAITRSLGDSVAHTIGVTCKPEVSLRALEDNDLLLILGSNGLWEQVSPQEAVNLAATSRMAVLDSAFCAKTAAEAITTEAKERWESLSTGGLNADVTCIVVKL